MVKHCDQGRRPRAAFSSLRSQFFTIRTNPKPALRTNQIIGFITVPTWEKNNSPYSVPLLLQIKPLIKLVLHLISAGQKISP